MDVDAVYVGCIWIDRYSQLGWDSVRIVGTLPWRLVYNSLCSYIAFIKVILRRFALVLLTFC